MHLLCNPLFRYKLIFIKRNLKSADQILKVNTSVKGLIAIIVEKAFYGY